MPAHPASEDPYKVAVLQLNHSRHFGLPLAQILKAKLAISLSGLT